MITEQVIIIGAGPCGLAAAIELQAAGLNPLIIEKRNIVYTVSQYPTYMHFFSTPELFEIGGIPFQLQTDEPSRLEALNYYRNVALRRQVRIRLIELLTAITPRDEGGFLLQEHGSAMVKQRGMKPRMLSSPQVILIIRMSWAYLGNSLIKSVIFFASRIPIPA